MTKTNRTKRGIKFPLTLRDDGRYCKKIRGVVHYFGRDKQQALDLYSKQKDDLLAGRQPRAETDGLSVGLLVNKYLTTKKRALEAGELSMHSWRDYYGTGQRLLEHFGFNRRVDDLRPDDFEGLKAKWVTGGWGPVRIGNEVNRVRMVFSYAERQGLMDKPMRFGDNFQRPKKQALRKLRAQQGPKMFEAAEIRRMLEAAGEPLRTMLLLAVNCGFGNNDVGTLAMGALDLQGGWVNFPRPKTGIDRRCPLWPETVEALKAWLERRRPSEAYPDRVFLTAKGGSWSKEGYLDEDGKPKNVNDNPVSKETRKLLDKLGINGHRNFYALRHTFQTIGEASRDFPAVRHIMGHADQSISDHYRERIDDARLRAVAEHVRGWLFS